MSILNLFNFSYWFSFQPPFEMGRLALVLSWVIFIGALVAAIVLTKISKTKNPPLARFLRHLRRPLIFFSVTNLIFLFFKAERIYLLGARFWFLLIFLGSVVWAIILVDKFLKTYKQDLAQLEKEKEFRKYLSK
ncbi:hypothetical protein HZC21_03735 [Candidatus Peregrinibacteria bacterium]|nr:hypothetical protein [Candidatus Peregrinibacteria bacterium]